MTTEYKDIHDNLIFGKNTNASLDKDQVDEYIKTTYDEVKSLFDKPSNNPDKDLSDYLKTINDETKLYTTLLVILDSFDISPYKETLKGEYKEELTSIRYYNKPDVWK